MATSSHTNIMTNRQKDTFIDKYPDITKRLIITNDGSSITPTQNSYISFFETQQVEFQNMKQEVEILQKEIQNIKQEIANILVNLTEIANNCCNIDQDFNH
jgi:hypothetical protein